MKRVLPIIMLLLSALFATAQNLTLNFTAVDQNGNPHDFTSVKIENLTRGWQHMLNYPETAVEIEVTQGIGELEGQADGLRLAGPNPFNGTAYAELQLAEAGPVEIMALQLDGKLVARCEEYLPSGVHRIKFNASSPQMYLLVAKTSQGSHTVKLMNTTNGAGNGIVLEKSIVSVEKSGNNSRDLGYFELGDEMRFTAYNGNEISETLIMALLEGGTITLTFNTDAPIVSGGRFSVSENTRVSFSPGNLQYQPSTGTWRFADKQWQLIGESNANISPSYSDWIDLFGWGTGDNPTNASTNSSDYAEFTDWGVNPISNGGNTANQWRTLTKEEWNYILFDRVTTSGIRFVKAKVALVSGLIILPDDWSDSYYSLNSINSNNAYWTTNTISLADWESSFATHGVVFLPAGGYRNGTSTYDVRGGGYYWTPSPNGSGAAFYMFFSGSNVSMTNYPRYLGHSVRLVVDE